MSEHWRHLGENWHLMMVAAQAKQFNLSNLLISVAMALAGTAVGTYNTTRDLASEVRHMNEKIVAVSSELRTMQEQAQKQAERNAERITRLEVRAEAHFQGGNGSDKRPR